MKTAPELEQKNEIIRTLLLEKETLLREQEKQSELLASTRQKHALQLQLQQQSTQFSDQLARKDQFIELLTEALILERNRLFARQSESMRFLQRDLFNEAEENLSIDIEIDDSELDQEVDVENDVILVPAHTRKKGGRKPLPKDLPRVDVIHDLSEPDKVCPHDGSQLTFVSDKVSEQLDIIPMQIQVIRNIRKQYHCPCCQKSGRDSYMKTASKPKQAIEKSMASSGLLAYLAVSKYADGLPLYRQSGILKRFDIELDRTTMSSWMIKCGQLVQPLINRLEEKLLTHSYLHMDETPVQVLNESGKSAESKSYMWVRCAGPPDQKIILFDYDASRSGSVPSRLLSGYEGALMVDGYAGYNRVCSDEKITRLGCMVHARRKFVDVVKVQGKKRKKTSKADIAIKLIGKLYALEREWEYHRANLSEPQFNDYRYQQRQEHAKPILDDLKTWCDALRPQVAPKTTLGQALHYLDNQWPQLIRYLKKGAYPIDNNSVENAIRPFAIGRKNWLFSASVRGAKASANLYSLIETAKAHDIDPYRYLKSLFDALPNIKDYDDVDKLLPQQFQVCR